MQCEAMQKMQRDIRADPNLQEIYRRTAARQFKIVKKWLGTEPVTSQDQSAWGSRLKHTRAKNVLLAAVGSKLALHRKKVRPLKIEKMGLGDEPVSSQGKSA